MSENFENTNFQLEIEACGVCMREKLDTPKMVAVCTLYNSRLVVVVVL